MTFSVPIELPGARVPLLVTSPAMVPLPPSVPPLLSVTAARQAAIHEERAGRDVVPPVKVLLPVRFNAPPPCRVRPPVPDMVPA